jgi:hypothetical protein
MAAPTSMGELSNLTPLAKPTTWQPRAQTISHDGPIRDGKYAVDAPPMTWKIPNWLPADVEGLQRKPSTLLMERALASRMLVSATIQGLVAVANQRVQPRAFAQYPRERRSLLPSRDRRVIIRISRWCGQVTPTPGAEWKGYQLKADVQGRWAQRGAERHFTHAQVQKACGSLDHRKGCIGHMRGGGHEHRTTKVQGAQRHS